MELLVRSEQDSEQGEIKREGKEVQRTAQHSGLYKKRSNLGTMLPATSPVIKLL